MEHQVGVLVNPDAVSAWGRIVRDVAIVLVGVFILLHETVSGGPPDPVLIGAGLVLLGVPPALRLDALRDKKGDDGKGG